MIITHAPASVSLHVRLTLGRLRHTIPPRTCLRQSLMALEALRNPGVLMFLKVVVCLDCGSAEFAIPEGELPKLATWAAARHHS
jgi:hypothetical protein